MSPTEIKISAYLQKEFDYPKAFSEKAAKKISSILLGHNDKWIPVTETLPEPQSICETANEYYLVKVADFGQQKAMYCYDENGNAGWYLSYIAKIIREVTHFMPII